MIWDPAAVPVGWGALRARSGSMQLRSNRAEQALSHLELAFHPQDPQVRPPSHPAEATGAVVLGRTHHLQEMPDLWRRYESAPVRCIARQGVDVVR